MSTLKAYKTFNPLKSRKNNEEDEKSEVLTEEIKHKIKLIKKAFRWNKDHIAHTQKIVVSLV